jgi:endonuclease YncB( thermonuclease family)
MFQPTRDDVLRRAAHQAGALAIAGLLALPLLATQTRDSAQARVGAAAIPSVIGPAQVVDGDTIVVQGVRVRLEGIDAPELEQSCARASGIRFWGFAGTWKCGREAAEHVERLVRQRVVRCEGFGTDAYGRMLGVCTVEGLEINSDLVRQGLAWAFAKYSQRYVAVEAEAKNARSGIWQAETKPAWEWRSERWQSAQGERRDAGPAGCVIKGNISRSDRIYHMPWDRFYERTRIEMDKGERWFCSEAEAVAAGWRAAGGR